MIYEKIMLREDNPDVYLECYCFHQGRILCDALLVIPGGGYEFVSPREGEPVVQAFTAQNFNCFVLHYSVKERAAYPNPLLDAALAMKHIKENAERYHINPDRVFAVGFSAGGHLCGMLGNLWHRPEIAELAETTSDVIRPNAVMLIYPVMLAEKFAHHGSMKNVTGGNAALMELMSLEKQVSEKSVPAFFMHTASDAGVPVENTLQSALAYSEHRIPFEVHVYPFGPHGMAVATEATAEGKPLMIDSEVAKWVDAAVAFARRF